MSDSNINQILSKIESKLFNKNSDFNDFNSNNRFSNDRNLLMYAKQKYYNNDDEDLIYDDFTEKHVKTRDKFDDQMEKSNKENLYNLNNLTFKIRDIIMKELEPIFYSKKSDLNNLIKNLTEKIEENNKFNTELNNLKKEYQYLSSEFIKFKQISDDENANLSIQCNSLGKLTSKLSQDLQVISIENKELYSKVSQITKEKKIIKEQLDLIEKSNCEIISSLINENINSKISNNPLILGISDEINIIKKKTIIFDNLNKNFAQLELSHKENFNELKLQKSSINDNIRLINERIIEISSELGGYKKNYSSLKETTDKLELMVYDEKNSSSSFFKKVNVDIDEIKNDLEKNQSELKLQSEVINHFTLSVDNNINSFEEKLNNTLKNIKSSMKIKDSKVEELEKESSLIITKLNKVESNIQEIKFQSNIKLPDEINKNTIEFNEKLNNFKNKYEKDSNDLKFSIEKFEKDINNNLLNTRDLIKTVFDKSNEKMSKNANEYESHLNQLNKHINDFIEERPLINDILMKYKSEIESLNKENSLILNKVISLENEMNSHYKNLLKPIDVGVKQTKEEELKIKSINNIEITGKLEIIEKKLLALKNSDNNQNLKIEEIIKNLAKYNKSLKELNSDNDLIKQILEEITKENNNSKKLK